MAATAAAVVVATLVLANISANRLPLFTLVCFEIINFGVFLTAAATAAAVAGKTMCLIGNDKLFSHK
jgi:hypothetical protein